MAGNERISAIGMHLEITARMVEDNEKPAEARAAKWTARIDRLVTIVDRLVERLAETAASHERSTERLEGN